MFFFVTLVAVLFGGIWIYNHQVSLHFRLQEALSGVDVQLKRRHDLIPNLVEVVKGYGHYEKGLLEKLALARSLAAGEKTPLERGPAEGEVVRGLRSLLAVVEAYPDVKADRQFLALQGALVKVEDELQMSRRYYNGTVRDYNVSVLSFPGNIIAGMAGRAPAVFFEIEYATERSVPDVRFQGEDKGVVV